MPATMPLIITICWQTLAHSRILMYADVCSTGQHYLLRHKHSSCGKLHLFVRAPEAARARARAARGQPGSFLNLHGLGLALLGSFALHILAPEHSSSVCTHTLPLKHHSLARAALWDTF